MTSQAMEPVKENDESLLHKATNPWKPLVLSRKVLTPEQSLYRTVKSHLNKLTPERFKTIVSKIQGLPIDSEDKLKAVVDLIYEKVCYFVGGESKPRNYSLNKLELRGFDSSPTISETAVLEPDYSVAYANMCRCLSMFKVPSNTKKDTMVNFRAVLLTRCQRQFEKVGDSKKGAQGTSETGCLDPTEMRKHKGLIRFIGEIFNVKMLTENKIHDMVFKLTRSKKTTNLDCSKLELACVLLTVVGKDLDTTKEMPRIDSYFNFLTKMMGEKKTEPKLRFILQDVIELRMNKWVPRQSVICAQPMSLAEVRRQMEELERQQNN